ncbi:MAG: choice-of-anchor D domain-containing protein [Myxococcota bacterium]
MRRPRTLLCLVSLAAACDDFEPFEFPDDGEGDGERLTVSPAEIDFGDVSVAGGPAIATLTLYNLGDAPATVTGHDEAVGSGAFVIDADPVVELAPGEVRELDVVYSPTTESSDEARLVVEPAGEQVRLLGRGRAPVLAEGDPELPAVVVGCAGEGAVPIANAGSETLVVTGATTDGEFEVVDVPGEIAPGLAGEVRVRFTPAGGGDRGATLLVSSNDPLRPEVGVPIAALGYEGERVVEAFRYTPSNPTDVLFAVEGGAAMLEHVAKGEAAAPAFVDTLRDVNVDYRLAAVDSSSSCPGVEPGWAAREDTSLRAENLLARAFDGEGGYWSDDLFGLAGAALDQTRGGCLDAFRRDDADLHLVLVTDGPAPSDAVEDAADVAEEWAAGAGWRVSVVIPGNTGCDSIPEGYEQVAEATGGVVADLCLADWTEAFVDIATPVEGDGVVRFPLAEAPVAATIEVWVEGATWTAWSYDEAERSVVFDGEQVPARGAEVELTYVSAVACEE